MVNSKFHHLGKVVRFTDQVMLQIIHHQRMKKVFMCNALN